MAAVRKFRRGSLGVYVDLEEPPFLRSRDKIGLLD
jgi:hypothetical protein